ncbi:hypothetical protein GGP41_010521 [Bipolaris sorokiniana]|uniref:Glycosyltransferase family 34 protein n=1 Tax=Cochliobolus sativus TaxID=45130 RepID=A0A8H5ZMI2_COCSA|nr:hypothetical protein GGP41_010521 [Bipolaris sorokiniana]
MADGIQASQRWTKNLWILFYKQAKITETILLRRLILASFAVFLVIVPLSYHHAIPIQRYRDYVTGDTVVELKTNNNPPQTQYFKFEPEWDWDAPNYASSLNGFKREPKPENVIVLTASDGGGHNSEIPNLLERVLENREEYCARHGYTSLWLNASRYDIGDFHRVRQLPQRSSKPLKCLTTDVGMGQNPRLSRSLLPLSQAEWIWLMDADMIIMTPSIPLISSILSPSAIEKGIMCSTMLLNGENPPTNIYTPTHYRVEDV